MQLNSSYSRKFNNDGREEFTFELPVIKPDWCSYAKDFNEWIEWLFREIVTEKPDNTISVKQAKLMLEEQYFEWRNEVTKPHKDYLGGPIRGHICIYEVYVQAYKKLRRVELKLQKPLLFLPQSPTNPDPGLYLGDER